MNAGDILEILNKVYDKAIVGIPHVSESVIELAEHYMQKYPDTSEAIDKLVNNQVELSGGRFS